MDLVDWLPEPAVEERPTVEQVRNHVLLNPTSGRWKAEAQADALGARRASELLSVSHPSFLADLPTSNTVKMLRAVRADVLQGAVENSFLQLVGMDRRGSGESVAATQRALRAAVETNLTNTNCK